MENNKDKPYSLQDAKDEVGYGYTVLLKDKLESLHQAAELYKEKATEELNEEIKGWGKLVREVNDKLLTSEARNEELRKERDSLKIELSNYAYQIDRAKRDRDTAEQQVERLKESNKELEQWKEEEIIVFGPLLDWGHNQTDIPLGSSITTEILKRLNEYKALKESNKELETALEHAKSILLIEKYEIERLKESNKELVEVLRDLSENLELQLGRLGCTLYGDGKDHLADNDSCGGFAMLEKSRDLIQKSGMKTLNSVRLHYGRTGEDNIKPYL